MKIVLCGPPHTGKSCLRYGLKEAIKIIPGSPYPYVITACPDGEGSWFQETTVQNPELAASLKKSLKGEFTEQFVARVAASVEQCEQTFVIIDIGGIPDDKNERICTFATHAVILFNQRQDLSQWQKFCNNLNLSVLAQIKSDYHGSSDEPLTLVESGLYQGAIHYLERGDISVSIRPTVIELAELIINRFNETNRHDKF